VVRNRRLAGDVVAVVGRLVTLGRREIADLVRREGGVFENGPSSRTTLLVVGQERRSASRDEAGASQDAASPRAPAESSAPAPGWPRRLDEDAFCALVGRPGPAMLRAQYYPLSTLRKLYPNIRDDQLRYLEKFGLLRSVVRTPGETWFGFSDLAIVRALSTELEGGASFRAVVRTFAAEERGQLALDFTPSAVGGPEAAAPAGVAPKVVPMPLGGRGGAAVNMTLAERVELGPAEQRFLAAERADVEADLEAAMHGYRQALSIDPGLVPAMVNLGNLHYAIDQLAEAQALYVQAAVTDPACFEAHFNLGNIYHDLGRFRQASMCYEDALRLNAGHADAHFYLAVSLEKLGESGAARPHWRRYLELAPGGEWVELAREFAEQ